MASEKGFTLLELMVAILVVGILAAMAIVHYDTMKGRAQEASTKANMHAFQFAVEQGLTSADGKYPSATEAAGHLRSDFKNPFDQSTGSGCAWETRDAAGGDPSARRGMVSYWTDSLTYNVKAYGGSAPLDLTLTSGS